MRRILKRRYLQQDASGTPTAVSHVAGAAADVNFVVGVGVGIGVSIYVAAMLPWK